MGVEELLAIRANVIGQSPEVHHDVYHHVVAVFRNKVLVQEVDDVDFETQVGHVDAVIDTVGGDTAVRAMKTLPRGGWFISTGNHDLDAQCAGASLKCAPYSSAADVERRIYEEVVSLVSAGKLEVKIDKSFPLADASQARAYSKAGHAEGKIILLVDAAQAERR